MKRRVPCVSDRLEELPGVDEGSIDGILSSKEIENLLDMEPRISRADADLESSTQYKQLVDFVLSFRDWGDRTLLHYVARLNLPDGVKLLLDIGAEIDFRDYGESTPLHDAAFHGSTEAAKCLIDAGADVTAVTAFDFGNDTPLHRAASEGHIEMMHMLLNAGAVLEAGESEDTPLHCAMRYGQSKAAEFLLHHGADPTGFQWDDLRIDIVLVGQNHAAVALERSDYELWIKIRGDGWLGQRIQEHARKKNIPVVECDPSVVQALFAYGIWETISRGWKHYQTVAEIYCRTCPEKALTFDNEKNRLVDVPF